MKTMTVSDAVKSLGISRQAIHQAIECGSLKAKLLHIGGYKIYQMQAKSVEKYRFTSLGKTKKKDKKA
jgi:hypothetical protein